MCNCLTEIVISFIGGFLIGGWVMHRFSIYTFRYAVSTGKITVTDKGE